MDPEGTSDPQRGVPGGSSVEVEEGTVDPLGSLTPSSTDRRISGLGLTRHRVNGV